MIVSPTATRSVTLISTMSSCPPRRPWTRPSARLPWSRAMTLERVSMTNRTRAVSSPTLTTVPGKRAGAVGAAHHRHPLREAVVAARVDGHLPGEVRRVDADDAHRQQLHVERVAQVQQVAQLLVLVGRLAELGDALLHRPQPARAAPRSRSAGGRSRRGSRTGLRPTPRCRSPCGAPGRARGRRPAGRHVPAACARRAAGSGEQIVKAANSSPLRERRGVPPTYIGRVSLR